MEGIIPISAIFSIDGIDDSYKSRICFLVEFTMKFAFYTLGCKTNQYETQAMERLLQEQGFEKEYDEYDNVAKTIVIYDGDDAVGTCRLYWDDEVGCHHVGRIAVPKHRRGEGLGALIVTEAERVIKELGGKEVFISGQIQVADFYKKLRYNKVKERNTKESG